MRQDEHMLQCACVRWFGYQYPEYHGMLFAVPNGGRRDAVTGARLKAEGVVAGVADLILLLPRGGYNCLCLELKDGKGRQSAEQKIWQGQVEKNGALYVIVRDFNSFVKIVINYINS